MEKAKILFVAGLVSVKVCCFAAWKASTPPPAAGDEAVQQCFADIQIEHLGGRAFTKKNFNGMVVYVAELPTPAGISANVNVLVDAQYGKSLPSMTEYARTTKEGFELMGYKEITVKEKDDNGMIITARTDLAAFFTKVIRDVGNSRFVVVTGTVVKRDGSEDELKSASRKVQRCVRSARLK